MNIGQTIKAARKERGFTLRQLAKNADVCYAHLSEIEHGKKKAALSTLDRIAFALGIRLSQLLTKAELDTHYASEVLLSDLQPLFRKIDSIAERLYKKNEPA